MGYPEVSSHFGPDSDSYREAWNSSSRKPWAGRAGSREGTCHKTGDRWRETPIQVLSRLELGQKDYWEGFQSSLNVAPGAPGSV